MKDDEARVREILIWLGDVSWPKEVWRTPWERLGVAIWVKEEDWTMTELVIVVVETMPSKVKRRH